VIICYQETIIQTTPQIQCISYTNTQHKTEAYDVRQEDPNVSNAFDSAGFISLKISVLWILIETFQSPLIVTLQNCSIEG